MNITAMKSCGCYATNSQHNKTEILNWNIVCHKLLNVLFKLTSNFTTWSKTVIYGYCSRVVWHAVCVLYVSVNNLLESLSKTINENIWHLGFFRGQMFRTSLENVIHFIQRSMSCITALAAVYGRPYLNVMSHSTAGGIFTMFKTEQYIYTYMYIYTLYIYLYIIYPEPLLQTVIG